MAVAFLLLVVACQLGGLIVYILIRGFCRGCRYLSQKDGERYEP